MSNYTVFAEEQYSPSLTITKTHGIINQYVPLDGSAEHTAGFSYIACLLTNL
jgi:hypothetical protein